MPKTPHTSGVHRLRNGLFVRVSSGVEVYLGDASGAGAVLERLPLGAVVRRLGAPEKEDVLVAAGRERRNGAAGAVQAADGPHDGRRVDRASGVLVVERDVPRDDGS